MYKNVNYLKSKFFNMTLLHDLMFSTSKLLLHYKTFFTFIKFKNYISMKLRSHIKDRILNRFKEFLIYQLHFEDEKMSEIATWHKITAF